MLISIPLIFLLSALLEMSCKGLSHLKSICDKSQRRIAPAPPSTTPPRPRHDRVAITWNPLRPDRQQRLDRSGVKTLYHATGRKAADSILTSQKMLRGSSGSVGGGIYFAKDRPTAERKQLRKSDGTFCLKADVKLGHSKVLDRTDSSITYDSLLKDGFDSVHLTALNGSEWVVYNWDQVSNIRRA